MLLEPSSGSKIDHVLAVLRIAEHDDRLFVLLRGQHADVAAVAQAVEQGLVGQHVELLHGLALHVGRRRRCPATSTRPARRICAATILVASVMPDSSQEKSPLACGKCPLLFLLNVLLGGDEFSPIHAGRRLMSDCPVRPASIRRVDVVEL